MAQDSSLGYGDTSRCLFEGVHAGSDRKCKWTQTSPAIASDRTEPETNIGHMKTLICGDPAQMEFMFGRRSAIVLIALVIQSFPGKRIYKVHERHLTSRIFMSWTPIL